jgi:hypothetical protein
MLANRSRQAAFVKYDFRVLLQNNEAIKAKERDDPSLVMPLVMALLVDQQTMVGKMKNQRRNNESPL